MKRTIQLLMTFCLLLSICVLSEAQLRRTPKKLKVEGDYIHNDTKAIFPVNIDNYNRVLIESFDKENSNIGVKYENKNNDKSTYFTIYIYPAGDGYEGRLRTEYSNCLQAIANNSDNGIHAIQYPVFFENEHYKIHGYKAELINNNEVSQLTLYECGKWFFKIRLSTNELDSSKRIDLEKKIIDNFNPTNFVKLSPLNPKTSVYMFKTAFRDSLFLGCSMKSAVGKINWTFENIDSLERISGFPDLYIGLQIASLMEFVKFEKEHPEFKKPQTTEEYLKELNSIIDAGFLKEFIMEQFDMVMIVPENTTFDFDAFDKWKQSRTLRVDLKKKFSVISFNQK